jgi:hypothetical protein
VRCAGHSSARREQRRSPRRTSGPRTAPRRSARRLHPAVDTPARSAVPAARPQVALHVDALAGHTGAQHAERPPVGRALRGCAGLWRDARGPMRLSRRSTEQLVRRGGRRRTAGPRSRLLARRLCPAEREARRSGGRAGERVALREETLAPVARHAARPSAGRARRSVVTALRSLCGLRCTRCGCRVCCSGGQQSSS